MNNYNCVQFIITNTNYIIIFFFFFFAIPSFRSVANAAANDYVWIDGDD